MTLSPLGRFAVLVVFSFWLGVDPTGLAVSAAAEFEVQRSEKGVEVTRDGQTVVGYLQESGNKPILWPVHGPGGAEMTRGYPMRPATEDEREDHIHHRSLWLTHGEVNDIDFWAEGRNTGTIRHREFLRVEGGSEAVIATANDWLGPDGQRVLSDRRRFTFSTRGTATVIDCDFLLIASDGPVHFGDTKEGTFGIRVPGTMKVDAKKGGKIENSRGEVDGKTWAQVAEWVDYHGPVDDRRLGIAVMHHPSSFGFPNRWHVRTYGLFAANPFGVFHFVGGEKTDGTRLEEGETLALSYRVVLHEGDTAEAGIAEIWEQYKETKVESL